MSILISFGKKSDTIWGGQGWLYLRLRKDIEDKFVLNEEIKKIFDDGELFQNLDIPSIEDKYKRIQIVSIIKETILEIITDSKEKFMKTMGNDREGYQIYKTTLLDLLNRIETYEQQHYPTNE